MLDSAGRRISALVTYTYGSYDINRSYQIADCPVMEATGVDITSGDVAMNIGDRGVSYCCVVVLRSRRCGGRSGVRDRSDHHVIVGLRVVPVTVGKRREVSTEIRMNIAFEPVHFVVTNKMHAAADRGRVPGRA